MAELQNGARLACQGKFGHPVGFASNYLADLLALTSDQGGKVILDAHRADLQLCPVADPGVLKDIDLLSQLVANDPKPESGKAEPA